MIRFFSAAAVALFLLTTAQASEQLTQRIVSVDANATEILLNFGMADQLVAADVTSASMLADKDLPGLGYHRALSAEGLLSTSPSLVIGSHHMGPPNVLEAIRSATIALVQLTPPMDVAGLINNVDLMADTLHKQQEAQSLKAELEQQWQVLSAKHTTEKPKMVFLMTLNERGLSQAGTGTAGYSLVELLGGQNISDYSGYKTVSIEALLEINPDVILVGSGHDGTDTSAELLAKNHMLSFTNAVKNNRFLSVDASKMIAGVSIGLLQEAERLSQLIY